MCIKTALKLGEKKVLILEIGFSWPLPVRFIPDTKRDKGNPSSYHRKENPAMLDRFSKLHLNFLWSINNQ